MQIENSGACKRCYRHSFKLISAVVLPLLLAVFTVVITFEQRKENDQQRYEDRELARIHREQDLNTSILTREADRLAAQLQRENDRDIANHQRNMSQFLESYRYEQERIKYLDNLLNNYLNEIGQLIKENNGSLTSKASIAALARTKTLHLIRIGIGTIRISQIIQFLYDAGQLNSSQPSLDLSGAVLDGISLNGLSMSWLALIHVRLVNATFIGTDLRYAKFIESELRYANFADSDCSHAVFINANAMFSDFTNTTLHETYFHMMNMIQSKFVSVRCTKTKFQETIMSKVDFSHLIIDKIEFIDVDLTEANFSFAQSNNFYTYDCLSFHGVSLNEANFTNSTISSLELYECNLIESIFYHAKIQRVNITFSNGTLADFTNADLSYGEISISIFAYAMFINTKIERVKFHFTDLSYANFWAADYSDSSDPFEQVLWIYNTILPDGQVGEFKNLIQYSSANCNLSLEQHEWKVNSQDIVRIQPLDHNQEKCFFVSNNTMNFPAPRMETRLDLSFYKQLISTGIAVLIIQTCRSATLNIDIVNENLNQKVVDLVKSDLSHDISVSIYPLDANTRNVSIRVTFLPQIYPEGGFLWLDYIQVTVSFCFKRNWMDCEFGPLSIEYD